jgi:isopenicillin N synthase-like dioxygenase
MSDRGEIDVPHVDISGWRNGDRKAIAAAVDDACRRIGFLQITGHGIPDAIIDDMLDATDRFFALPLDTKRRATPEHQGINRGYAALGTEALAYSLGVEAARPDLFEAFNIGLEDVDRSDPFYAADPHGFFAQNVWPTDPGSLRPALLAYFDEAHRVARTLIEVFGDALGLGADWFAPFTDRSTLTMRVNHYERRADDPQAEPGQMRMGAHTDYGIVTVLYADNVPGLEIVGPDGEWHGVVPRPGALLVNLGDLTAQWTNDRWRSTLHRVVPPPPDAAGAARRRSVAFFFDANYDAVVECLPTCRSDTHPPRYSPVVAGEHLMAKVLGPRTLTPSNAADTAGDRLRPHDGVPTLEVP